jgi:hypothetical protein
MLSDSIRRTVMWVTHKLFPFSLMTLAGLVVCGVCVPVFYPHAKGLATVLLVLWDWGTGFATVATALLIILAAISSLTKNLSSAPVIIVSLFGTVALLVGSQIVQLYVVNHLIHPGFRYATPSWGLWFAFAPSLLGVFIGISWIGQLRTSGLRRESGIH